MVRMLRCVDIDMLVLISAIVNGKSFAGLLHPHAWEFERTAIGTTGIPIPTLPLF